MAPDSEYRINEIERVAREAAGRATNLDTKVEVLTSQFNGFVSQTKERWQDEDRKRQARQEARDEWEETQEKKLDSVRKLAVGALVAFTGTLIAGIVDALILLSGAS